MTLPPSRIGDKGQRYEIRWRKSEDARETHRVSHRVLGWAEKLKGAREMRDAWLQAPDVLDVWIVDRAADVSSGAQIDREAGKRVD